MLAIAAMRATDNALDRCVTPAQVAIETAPLFGGIVTLLVFGLAAPMLDAYPFNLLLRSVAGWVVCLAGELRWTTPRREDPCVSVPRLEQGRSGGIPD